MKPPSTTLMFTFEVPEAACVAPLTSCSYSGLPAVMLAKAQKAQIGVATAGLVLGLLVLLLTAVMTAISSMG